MTKSKNMLGWLFSTPYMVLAVLFFFIPLIWALYISITDWNLISVNYDIIGLKNYMDAVLSPEVRHAFINTFKYAAIIVPFTVVFSFIYAYVIHKLPTHLKSFFTITFFLPYLTSGVATSILVKGLLSYGSPIYNFFNTNFGISWDIRSDATFAIFVISAMIIWKMSSYYFLFFLSSLESLGSEINEAALIDGSTGFNKLFKVTIPNLYPAFFTIVSLCVGLSFSIYTEPFLLTSGGPDNMTTTWQLLIYQKAFINFESGYAAAIAIINAILVFISIYFIQKLLKTWGRHNGHEV